MNRSSCLLTLAIAALTLLPACTAPLNRPAPERRFYSIEAKRPDVTAPAPRDATVLKVRPAQISPAYQGKEMVYRLDDVRFESDYYNAFFVQPASALTRQIEQWLGRSGVFGHVVDSTSQVRDAFLLEGMVNALYGDFRDKAAPKAVLEAQFFLLASVNESYQVAFSRSYRQEVPVPAGFKDASGLAEAFNAALAATLKELEKDLRAARAAGFK